MHYLQTSLRIAIASMAVCVVGYTGVVLALAHLLVPWRAGGSLLEREDGSLVGSRLVAQAFTDQRYFWPRPSAVDYDAAGAGGSNKSPTNELLSRRALELAEAHRATVKNPMPPELVTASGSGLDPHLSERAALYQAERICVARALDLARVEALVRQHAFAPGGLLTPDRIVNVLELNIALDQELGGH